MRWDFFEIEKCTGSFNRSVDVSSQNRFALTVQIISSYFSELVVVMNKSIFRGEKNGQEYFPVLEIYDRDKFIS